ncbi:hypothetical protein LTR62_004854 [Meristemomyces frigidus]|uniref:Uncharacterized protein n=1 Tax=Meristemomyces frigidus TaxID=1508187 RepID=A0AAN7YFR1_9PEZI|nr:hypothetical protein LTR62_004854 [Meristemomyces frigidus]
MAPATSIQSVESRGTINVSKNAQSSSPVSKVEDSMNQSRRGGPLQSPDKHMANDSYEDLYSVTPETKKPNAKHFSTKPASVALGDIARAALNAGDPPQGEVGHESRSSAMKSPSIAEFIGGIGMRRESQASSTAGNLDPRYVAEDVDSKSGPFNALTGHGAYNQGPALGSAAHETQGIVAKSGSSDTSLQKRVSTPAPNSTLAALRARKSKAAISSVGPNDMNEKAPMVTAPKAPLNLKEQVEPVARVVLAKKDANTRTAANNEHSATAKLKSRRLGMFATTPAKPPTRAAETKTVPFPQRKPGRPAAFTTKVRAKKTSPEKIEVEAAASLAKKSKVLGTAAPAHQDPFEVPSSPASPPQGRQPKKSVATNSLKAGKPGNKLFKLDEDLLDSNGKRHSDDDSDHPLAKKGKASQRKSRALAESDEYVDAPVGRRQVARKAKSSTWVKKAKDTPMQPDLGGRHDRVPKAVHTVTEVIDNGRLKDSEQTDTHIAADDARSNAEEDRGVCERLPLHPLHCTIEPEYGDQGAQFSLMITGGTQDKAIVLSDRIESSSELDDDEEVPTEPQTLVNSRRAEAPQTPAAPRSSPPDHTLDTQARLVTGPVSKRSTIIGFDRSGPRNQGTRSVKRPAETPWLSRAAGALQKLTSARQQSSARTRLDARHKQEPSSVAASAKTNRTDGIMQQNNVAPTVDDALTDLLGPSTESATHPTLDNSALRTKPTVEVVTDYEGYEGMDDDYIDVDDTQPALVQAPRLSSQATKPQPGPNELLTASQVMMPPPAKKQIKIERTSQTARVQAPKAYDLAPDLVQPSERSFQKDGPLKAMAKEQKIRAAALMRNETQNGAAHDLPLAAADINAARRAVNRLKKIGRIASQGNVDLGGSPIPKDMEVPQDATVLETFSQRAGISSDPLAYPRPVRVNDAKIADDSAHNPTIFEQILSVSSHQPTRQKLASNEKRRPLSPRQESQAITGVALRKLDTKRLVIHDEALPPPTDPFTSSGEAQTRLQDGGSVPTLGSELRKTPAAYMRKRRNEVKEKDPDKTLVESSPPPKRYKPTKAPQTARKEIMIADEADPDTSAIDFWRHGLQLHQMNMFDELVGISHRLMKNLVDRETAMREAVSDYRTKGLHLIEELERKQVEQYEASKATFEEKKARIRENLSGISEGLRVAATAMAERREERSGICEELDVEEGRLTELLEQMR